MLIVRRKVGKRNSYHMGLLFVLEGDEAAKESYSELNLKDHAQFIKLATTEGPGMFPLVRRANRFYGDVLFETDEIKPFISELRKLNTPNELLFINQLVELCEIALAKNRGIETIAD